MEPTECENCGSSEEHCTDNYCPDLGWVCEDCADTWHWEQDNGIS